MSAMKIKKGDMVKVIAGKDKNKEGKVLAVNNKDGKVLVEGCLLYTSFLLHVLLPKRYDNKKKVPILWDFKNGKS